MFKNFTAVMGGILVTQPLSLLLCGKSSLLLITVHQWGTPRQEVGVTL